MKIILTAILISSFIINLNADEVYLKSEKIWLNVSIIENETTRNTVTIWTSWKKKIYIPRKEIINTIVKKFIPTKKSELVKATPELVEKFYKAKVDNKTRKNEENIIAVKKIVNEDSVLKALPQMRLSVGGGFSFRTVEIPNGLASKVKAYYDDLK